MSRFNDWPDSINMSTAHCNQPHATSLNSMKVFAWVSSIASKTSTIHSFLIKLAPPHFTAVQVWYSNRNFKSLSIVGWHPCATWCPHSFSKKHTFYGAASRMLMYSTWSGYWGDYVFLSSKWNCLVEQLFSVILETQVSFRLRVCSDDFTKVFYRSIWLFSSPHLLMHAIWTLSTSESVFTKEEGKRSWSALTLICWVELCVFEWW